MPTDDSVPYFGVTVDELRLVGPALRYLRHISALPQNVVAERAGITKAMLSSYETGKVMPTLGSLAAVLRELRCDFRRFQDTLERLRLGTTLDLPPDVSSPHLLEREVGRAVLQIVAQLTGGGERGKGEGDEAPVQVDGDPEASGSPGVDGAPG